MIRGSFEYAFKHCLLARRKLEPAVTVRRERRAVRHFCAVRAIKRVRLVCVDRSAYIYRKREQVAVRCAAARYRFADGKALFRFVVVCKHYVIFTIRNIVGLRGMVCHIAVLAALHDYIRRTYVKIFKYGFLVGRQLQLSLVVRHVVARNLYRITRIRHVVQLIFFIFIFSSADLHCKCE